MSADDSAWETADPGRWASLDRILSFRYPLMIFVGAAAVVLAGGRGDWNYFVDVGRSMLSDAGLGVYADFPDVQTGPLSLAAAAALSFTGRNGFVVAVILTLACGVWTILRLELADVGRATPERTLHALIGGCAVMIWWSQLGKFGHLDDALTLTLATSSVLLHRQRQTTVAAVLIGVACLVKPWAVIFAPLTLDLDHEGRPAIRRSAINVTVLVGVTASGWLPFVVADRDTLDAGQPTVGLAPDSVLRLLGLDSLADESALRLVQIGLALAVATALVVRRRPEAVLLGALVCRVILDPGTWSYYTAAIVLGAFVIDELAGSGWIPWLTLFAAVLIDPPFAVLSHDPTRATLRLVSCIVLFAAAFTWPRQGHRTDVETVHEAATT